jgi:hypothetical protein
MIVCFEIFVLLLSEFGRSFISRIRFCSASGSDIYNILIIYMYAIELLSFGNGMYFAFIYLLNTIQVSKAIVHVVHLGGLTANVTHLDTSQIDVECPFY